MHPQLSHRSWRGNVPKSQTVSAKFDDGTEATSNVERQILSSVTSGVTVTYIKLDLYIYLHLEPGLW